MRGNQPGSPDTLFQELILASWSSSSIHTYPKLQKSTGPAFPRQELLKGPEGARAGHELGAHQFKPAGAGGTRPSQGASQISWLCGEPGCCGPRLSTKRLGNATPRKTSEACSLAVQPSLVGFCPWRASRVPCAGEGKGSAFFFSHHL